MGTDPRPIRKSFRYLGFGAARPRKLDAESLPSRLELLIPTFDPANGDKILVFKTEAANGGRSLRLSPELGAEFRSYIFRAIREKQTENRSVGETILARCLTVAGFLCLGCGQLGANDLSRNS
ncbi:hypothetical protein [Mesorhizobium muleiense]|uniref:hypothetical protein n=1 Tax=Mesorhizobium muleiense TaxID=1004279 RepID=UPI001F3B849A|nr:hypothetical protein [Mesorhizobium muleiense]MCF6113356.1 hypothetical protein [Mesorhizobium muleiense]